MYRESDAECTGLDAAPLEERHQLFQERYDVLSQEASQRVSGLVMLYNLFTEVENLVCKYLPLFSLYSTLQLINHKHLALSTHSGS